MTRFKQEDSDTCPLSMIYTAALIKQGLKQVNTSTKYPSLQGRIHDFLKGSHIYKGVGVVLLILSHFS